MSKKDFKIVIKVRILRWAIILDCAGGLSAINHKDPQERGMGVRVRKGDVMSKAEVGVMRRGHEEGKQVAS